MAKKELTAKVDNSTKKEAKKLEKEGEDLHEQLDQVLGFDK